MPSHFNAVAVLDKIISAIDRLGFGTDKSKRTLMPHCSNDDKFLQYRKRLRLEFRHLAKLALCSPRLQQN